MAVFLKPRQVLLIFSFFALFAPANFTEGGVNCQPIQPCRKLRISTKTFGLPKSRPKNILNDFFDVCNFAQNFLRHVVKFCRVTIEDQLEGLLVPSLEPFDEVSIVMLRFVSGFRARRALWRCGRTR